MVIAYLLSIVGDALIRSAWCDDNGAVKRVASVFMFLLAAILLLIAMLHRAG